MRAYRFVDFLGTQFEAAGRAVADSALVEFDHRGGLKAAGADTPNERVGYELLRQIARRLDGQERGPVQFAAGSFAPVDGSASPESDGGTVGILYRVALPGFEHHSAILAETYYRPHVETWQETADDRDGIGRLREWLTKSPSAYRFVVDESGTRVVPGQSIASLREPIDRETVAERLYSKSLKRFAEGLAEGFHGDPRLATEWSYPSTATGVDEACRDWASAHGIGGVLFVEVTPVPDRNASSLEDFV